MILVTRIEPEHLACAFHQAQQKRQNSPQGYRGYRGCINASLKHSPIVLDEVLPRDEIFGQIQSLTPEDVRPGYEVGELVKRTEKTYDANYRSHDVTRDEYEPWGRVLAVFHHYGRREPILYALGSGKSKGVSSGETYGRGPCLCRSAAALAAAPSRRPPDSFGCSAASTVPMARSPSGLLP